MILLIGGIHMAWSYIKLWKLLLDKGMKRIDLAAAANLTSNTLAKLGKNKEVSMETLNKIDKTSRYITPRISFNLLLFNILFLLSILPIKITILK